MSFIPPNVYTNVEPQACYQCGATLEPNAAICQACHTALKRSRWRGKFSVKKIDLIITGIVAVLILLGVLLR